MKTHTLIMTTHTLPRLGSWVVWAMPSSKTSCAYGVLRPPWKTSEQASVQAATSMRNVMRQHHVASGTLRRPNLPLRSGPYASVAAAAPP